MLFTVPVLLCGLAFAGAPAPAPDFPAYQAAMNEFQSGNFRQASATLQDALQQHPQNVSAEILLARCYYELRDWDRAVAHAESAVRMDPADAEAHLWLGRTYGRKADQAHSLALAVKTRSEFQKAASLAPRNVEAHRDLMEYYLEAPWIIGGSKDKARKEARTIATLDPVEGKLAEAQVAKQSGHMDKAREEYENLLSMKLDRVGPYLEAADFYLAHQNIAKFVAA
ncbi:MAG: tetratricopeptide repeat protein, partial [Terriglobia bacterium]